MHNPGRYYWFLAGIALGVALMLVPYGNTRQREIKLRRELKTRVEQLDCWAAEADRLADYNLQRSNHQRRAFIEIKRLQNSGASVASIVDAARAGLFDDDSPPTAK